MRVLHLTDHYPPALGGIETHVRSLSQRQAARGDDVTVLTSSPGPGGSHEDGTDGRVRVLRASSLRAGLAVDVTAFDVVHAHVSVVAPFTSPWTAVAARRGVPTLVTVHSLWNGMGPVPGAAAALSGLRSAPVLWTAVSQVAARHVAVRVPRDAEVQVLPNAVDVVARPQTPGPRPDGSVHLVSTMRLARRKRPLPLVRMFRDLQRSVRRPLRLTVVGDGPQLERVAREVEACGLEGAVTLTGRVTPAQVPQLLAGADLYVAPAILESFGLAALEARCVGLPVVGHSASGLTEFVRPGVEGLLGRTDDDIVDLLRELVLDDAFRHNISEHNRQVPSTMTWAHSLRHHDAAYELACARARRPRGMVPLLAAGWSGRPGERA